MATFSELVISIASDLRQGGFVKDADDLEQLGSLVSDQTLLPDVRRKGFTQIGMRCHVKWLGDLYLPHLSQKDWWGKLENLGKLAKKHEQSI